MILSRFLSNSSASFSSFRLDSDDAPHICISISAKRCSKSHCCCDNFVFNVEFSASTVWSLSRSLRISSSSASCDPNSGVAPDDSKWFNDPHGWPYKYFFLLKLFKNCYNRPYKIDLAIKIIIIARWLTNWRFLTPFSLYDVDGIGIVNVVSATLEE